MKEIFILGCEKKEAGGGIYRCRLGDDGSLEAAEKFACDYPMYAALYGGRMYVILKYGGVGGNSSCFSIKPDFSDISEAKDTLGECACHLAVSEKGVYIVNYLSGNISKNCATCDVHTGRGVNLPRQNSAHTHFVGFTPDGKNLLCTDLGLDTITVYDENLGVADVTHMPEGYGVRHLVFSSSGKSLYAINELVPSVTLCDFSGGRLKVKDTVLLQCGLSGSTAAAIRMSDGIIYASVRKEQCIFTLSEKLEVMGKFPCGGEGPRDFDIFGKFIVCCNENSGTAVSLPVDGAFIGSSVSSLDIPGALCCVENKYFKG